MQIPTTQWAEGNVQARLSKTNIARMVNKNKINQKTDPSGIVSVIKLKRTDTTLDLSQKAKRAKEKRKEEEEKEVESGGVEGFFIPESTGCRRGGLGGCCLLWSVAVRCCLLYQVIPRTVQYGFYCVMLGSFVLFAVFAVLELCQRLLTR